MTPAFLELLSECTWIGFKATDEERKLIKRYAERLREAKKEGVWVDPIERKEGRREEHLKFCGWCRQGLECPYI